MERRKVQLVGGNTFMVSLPKKWADRIGLKKQDEIEIEEQPDGALWLSPMR
jgi:phosphate uptake regulator